jgi:hypothetical protein
MQRVAQERYEEQQRMAAFSAQRRAEQAAEAKRWLDGIKYSLYIYLSQCATSLEDLGQPHEVNDVLEQYMHHGSHIVCGLYPLRVFDDLALKFPEHYRALIALAESANIRIVPGQMDPAIIICFAPGIAIGNTVLDLAEFVNFCRTRVDAFKNANAKNSGMVKRNIKID